MGSGAGSFVGCIHRNVLNVMFPALSLMDSVTDLQEKGIGFKSLTEAIDTTTSGGKLVFHIFGALAEFERDIIRERTQAGLRSARRRGRNGGRRFKLTPKQLQIARELYASQQTSVADICKTSGI
jgi:DNA invertase Pin-like site-specific DNA recombinase